MERKGGLGRGLGALIPSAPSPVPPGAPTTDVPQDSDRSHDDQSGRGLPVAGAVYRELDPASIAPNAKQPRSVFEEDALAELVHSIREVGVLQPVVVREISSERYELVMGERRWRAAQQAGLTAIPAIVRVTTDDAMLRDALLENLHRQQLNPLEEAAAYQQLLEEFGATHEELAQRIGRSRPQISNTIRLLQLTAPVQRRVAAGILSAGHARALLGLSDAVEQEKLALRIVAEGLSVRAVEELVSMAAPQRPGRGQRSPKSASPELVEVQERLAERFQTRVKVNLGRSKGAVTIEFADLDDLDRILQQLESAPQS